MRSKSTVTFVLAGALIMAALAPALAAKHRRHVKPTGACAQSSARCISDCDALGWCTMNTCVSGQSTKVPFWRCYQPSGLCLAPHC